MDPTQPPLLYILIAAAVLVVGLVIAAVVASRKRRSERERLRERYGPEYDRTLETHRNKRAAIADLKDREEQREHLELRDLNPADLALVRKHMAMAQYRFVEDPVDAVRRTEHVMTEVLRAKGYPVDDRGNVARLFSVDHPEHADTVRSTLEAPHSSDARRLREQFLQARKTIAEITGTSFGPQDAAASTEARDDLRVERSSDSSVAAGRQRDGS